jgi:nicotinate dehydrogenase subunit B
MRHFGMLARRDVLKGAGLLLVSFAVPTSGFAQESKGKWPTFLPNDAIDSYLAIGPDGRVTAFTGRVELGTGVQTALSQIVADELDVAFEQVTLVMGDTDKAMRQGRTSASDTIQVWANFQRRAAAEARRFLVNQAAEKLGVPAADLKVENGIVIAKADPAKKVSYGEIIGAKRFNLPLLREIQLKKPSDYKIVGKSIPRVDIPGKVFAQPVFVHDIRRPGMVHARVIRPPYPGIENQMASSLVSVDESSVKQIPGLIKVVVIRDFVAVVAEREENAIRAARALRVVWKPWAGVPDHTDLESVIRDHPGKPRTVRNDGDVVSATSKLHKKIEATYVWPYHLHGSIGPSCAVAEIVDGHMTIWSATRDPGIARSDAAALVGMPVEAVRVLWLEGSGSYGRNCTDDATLEAALLAKEIDRPVRVQVMRDEEHAWEPKGAAHLIDIQGGIDATGKIVAYDVTTKFMGGQEGTAMAPFLIGQKELRYALRRNGDRNASPLYSGIENVRVTCVDVNPAVRTSLLRGVASLSNSFANECFMDELAASAAVDPAEFRLRHLTDPRAVALMKAMLDKAGWEYRPGRKMQEGNILKGRGVSYARYTHGDYPGHGAAYTAWVAEVEVDASTGQVRITRVVVGQDAGLMINPAGCEHQIRGNVIQAVSRILREEVTFDKSGVTSSDWTNYPIATFKDIPQIDIVMINRPEEKPLGVGESAIVPSAGAIANAIYDAAGVRLRRVPFTPERVKLALGAQALKNG